MTMTSDDDDDARGCKGPKIGVIFCAAKTHNLTSPDAVSEALKCSKVLFWSGLRHGPRWGSSQRSPDFLSALRGLFWKKQAYGKRN